MEGERKGEAERTAFYIDAQPRTCIRSKKYFRNKWIIKLKKIVKYSKGKRARLGTAARAEREYSQMFSHVSVSKNQ